MIAIRNILLIAALGLIVSFTTYDAHASMFLSIPSIPGSSTTQGFTNDIVLNSFHFSNARTITLSSGSTEQQASAPAISDLVITKTMDKSSPGIVKALLLNQGISKIDIFLTKASAFSKGQFVYAHYVLSNVLFSSYSVSSGGDAPTESIGINFEKLQTTVTTQNPDGSVGQTISFCWNESTNQECSTSTPSDTTPPTVTGSIAPAPNSKGWNNSTVTITWSGTDTESGIKSCDAPTIYSGPDTSGINETGHCTDNAGNIGAGNVTIHYDATKPIITGAPTTAPNTNGWYRNNVTVNFTATDATSGIATITPDVMISTEGKNQNVTGTAIDNAGNVANFTVSGINIDKIPPTVSATPSRLPDHNGWYNHPVVISWTGTDASSGIDSCDTATNYVGPDGTSITLTGDCIDKAGNNGSSTVTFKYDATPPSLTVSSNMTVFPTNPSGALVSYPQANSTDDEPSSASCSPLSGSEFSFGSDIVTCMATDDAGNNATKTFTITVLTPIQAGQKLVSVINGMSLPGGETNSLDAKLAAVLSSLNSHNNNTAKNQLNAFINEVNAQTGKKITQTQATQLLQDAQDIINSMP